jgi:hypothetical protein
VCVVVQSRRGVPDGSLGIVWEILVCSWKVPPSESSESSRESPIKFSDSSSDSSSESSRSASPIKFRRQDRVKSVSKELYQSCCRCQKWQHCIIHVGEDGGNSTQSSSESSESCVSCESSDSSESSSESSRSPSPIKLERFLGGVTHTKLFQTVCCQLLALCLDETMLSGIEETFAGG